MTTRHALVALALAGAMTVGAQTAKVVSNPPLQCGKYQHVDHWAGTCAPAPCNGESCFAVCYPPPPDHCVDDIHQLTEREWHDLQEILTRTVNILEAQVKALANKQP